MKIKSKAILSLSSLLIVSVPIATVISCGNLTREGWNDIGADAANKSMLSITEKELVFSGSDGTGSVRYKPKNGKIGMFSQAQAKITMKIARYKKSTINKDAWEELFLVDFADTKMQKWDEQRKINSINDQLTKINNLNAQDKLKIEIVSQIQGYKDKVMKMQPFEIANEKLNYDPLKPATKLIKSNISTSDNKQLEINLDNFKNDSLSEIALSIAEGMGMLISSDLSKKLKDFKPNSIYKSIINMHDKGINKIHFTYHDKTSTKQEQIFDFSNNKQLKTQLNKTLASFQDIFMPKGNTAEKQINQATNIDPNVKIIFEGSELYKEYKKIFNPSVATDILKLISNIKNNGNTNAIKNLSDLTFEYSKIFDTLKSWTFLKNWIDEIRFRNLKKLDSIILSTIWRSK